MSLLDWVILFGTLLLIAGYGAWKSRKQTSMDSYLLGNQSMPWWSVCLSIMATQASAVTFLSTPGQAFEDGMRFLQFYFGLPLAMIILSISAVPLYHRLKVYTAYEYLEGRFDVKTRTLTAVFFLFLRGLSVGITVYAPSLILSTILGWNIHLTTLLIGMLVMIYTVSGGSQAVSLTQRYQLTIIMFGMLMTGYIAYLGFAEHASFGQAFRLAGEMGKLNLISLDFNLSDRYNIWSGLLGGLFLFLSYFGADQSQVGRYLGGKSVGESRLGLIFNGLLKIPMQFVILYIGILVFLFYQFQMPPAFHNQSVYTKALQSNQRDTILRKEAYVNSLFALKREKARELASAIRVDDQSGIMDKRAEWRDLQDKELGARTELKRSISEAVPGAQVQDKDYVFINFVMTHLPAGLVGFLLAVVFSAAMSSTASELTALASTSMVDIYRRSISSNRTDIHYVKATRWFTVGWAVVAMIFASLANQAENLIQFVNIVGSLFYGTILGIFLSAFYIRYIKSTAVFIGGLAGEATILYLYFFKRDMVAFLHYNYIGCIVVILVALIWQFLENSRMQQKSPA
ncbi:MAG: sodium:solute symporter [Cyclobacteriaceae bacterium]